ncbi:MAG: site-2 protease family protein [Candidatus Omnitrophica bacterium]|nr:site-2 protease family protein [Candidatus Omnitrophota bacterium]
MQIIGILAAMVIFGFIILVHEFGHYIVGKLSGCSVSKFSIGWGPKLLAFKRRETEYRISWIPFIGGYVRMPGIEGESAELTEDEAKDIKKYNLKTFEEIRTWQKFLVFIAGVGMQVVVAALILTVVVCMMGKPMTKVYVMGVAEGSPAQSAGLKGADIILKVGETGLSSVEELTGYISDKAGRKVKLTIEREEKRQTLIIVPRYDEEHQKVLIGINIAQGAYFEKESMVWHDYVFGGVIFTGRLTVQMAKAIWMLITGEIPLKGSAMGPVGIIALTKDIAQTGFINMVLFFVLININIGFINLIPYPALDGGHVLFLAIEKTFRFKIKEKVKEVLVMAGFASLILLILYLTYNDVGRFISSRFGKDAPRVQQGVEDKE